ncbi:hypothetical protein FLONG3_7786 [Fusarium longipes]|uniref:Uncharacterized protein n=1 Tax=Fusarium longipes TaxID=694270 RepID=A0A395SAL0_9HYPO|nr:hypothetical protein FLONG3_7786 [Fusarium longipes]
MEITINCAIVYCILSSPCDLGTYQGSTRNRRLHSVGSGEPRLTPQELGALFVDFYSFMATLNFNKSDLKIPPPTGWPEITLESCGHVKSDYAVEVIRHLPYFENKGTTQFHYRSKVLDLRAWTPEDFKSHHETHDGYEFWSSEDEQDPSDVVCIAEGYGTAGRVLWLLVKDGEIIEHLNKVDLMSAVTVEDFFSNLGKEYENLKLIPGEGRITIEAENVPKRKRRITEDEVNSQTEEWGTELDIQYVRQIYRDHGWPHSFNFEAASRAINTWLEPLDSGKEGSRGLGWEIAEW